ncbi:TPA: hypothetical protein DIV45_00535 [Patescibacteria group bacterium]|nr:hypothetical protein [Patescibacteria group bacterium]
MIRLNKYLAAAGIASRRKADELVTAGLIKVNGRVVTDLGAKIDPEKDKIEYRNRLIKSARPIIFMFNKPVGVTSTMSDKHAEKTIADYFTDIGRVYPVGRLDKDSEGLILVTNNGELTNKLTHPRYEHEKEYEVIISCRNNFSLLPQPLPAYRQAGSRQEGSYINSSPAKGRKGGDVQDNIINEFSQSFVLNGYKTRPMQCRVIKQISPPHPTSPYQGEERRGCWLILLVLKEGRKRQIRRIAELLGYRVDKLKRVRIGKLKLGQLPAGKYAQVLEQDII